MTPDLAAVLALIDAYAGAAGETGAGNGTVAIPVRYLQALRLALRAVTAP